MPAERQFPLAPTNDIPPGAPAPGSSVKYSRANLVDLHIVNSAADVSTFIASSRPSALSRLGRRAFDIFGALILGILFLPLIVLTALFIRLEGEPVIYRHPRVGRHGRMFECLKFRTMVPNADHVLKELLRQHPEVREEWLKNHKLRHDPRITAIGRFLRKTSLDELPQLWNVLTGDMSLVGPRPVTRDELGRYGHNVSTYITVKPGLTGLWQVTRCSTTTYRRRVAMDVYYVRNRNVLLDVYILLATASVVVGKGDGAY